MKLKSTYCIFVEHAAVEIWSPLCALSRNVPFFITPLHISSPAPSCPYLPLCSPQPANRQNKISIKYFQQQLIAPISSDLHSLSAEPSRQGIHSCITKIKTLAIHILSFHLQESCLIPKSQASAQQIWSFWNTEMLLTFNWSQNLLNGYTERFLLRALFTTEALLNS
jgi:hypothetical protein